LEEMVELILSCCPGVTRESVLEKLKAERKRAGGLISDEALLRLIAAGLGCDVQNGEAAAPALSLRDLIPGLNSISVAGRVVAAFSPRAFNRSRKGRFASLLIADDSGVTRVVLWNDKAGLAEPGGVRVGDVIRLSRGYTREDYGGKVEVHVGEKGVVEVNPADMRSKDYPSIGKFTVRIGQLPRVKRNSRVNIVGKVERLGSVSQFERSDLSSGKVMRLVLSDGTGKLSVVLWNEKVDEVEGLLKVDVGLQVVNGKLKKEAGGGLEVHVDGSTYIEAQALPEFSPLTSLSESAGNVNVAGEVVSKPMIRDVKTSRQGMLRLASFELKDETGRIWVSAWRNHADSVKDLKVGDRVIIKNACVRKGFGDQIELSTRNSTSIVKEA
jgi:replication factor A1